MEIKFNKVNYDGLKKLSLDIADNSIVSFMGDSSKKYIVKLLSLLDTPDSGSVVFDNFEISHDSLISFDLDSKIGFVLENPEEQFSFDNVREELEFVIKNYNYKLYDIENRVNDSLKLVGLTDKYLDLNPFNLSLSERKKLSLAMALVFNPKILVLENISLSLDNKSKSDLVKLIKRLKYRYKKTIIIVSNDSDFVHMVTDNVYIINKGKIVSSGDKYTIFSDYDNLLKYDILMPKIMCFSYLVKQKKKKFSYWDDINDLIKDVYKNAK